MVTALREKVTYVFRIHFVQQIIENYETRSTVVIAKILEHTLVKTDVLMYSCQLLSQDGRLLTVTPDDHTAKVRFRTQRIEMLHETQGKRGLARSRRTTHDARERMFEPNVVGHVNDLFRQSRPVYIPERE